MGDGDVDADGLLGGAAQQPSAGGIGEDDKTDFIEDIDGVGREIDQITILFFASAEFVFGVPGGTDVGDGADVLDLVAFVAAGVSHDVDVFEGAVGEEEAVLEIHVAAADGRNFEDANDQRAVVRMHESHDAFHGDCASEREAGDAIVLFGPIDLAGGEVQSKAAGVAELLRFGEIGLALAQDGLGLLEFTEVADEAGETALAVVEDLGEGDLGGELGAVAAMRHHVQRAQGRWVGGDAIDQGGERTAEEGVRTASEDLCGSAVGEDDLPGFVADEHGIGGGVGDDAAVLVAEAAGLVGALFGSDKPVHQQRGDDEDGELCVARRRGR